MPCKDFYQISGQITIGLDVGIASIGWAVLETPKEKEVASSGKIVDLGVRIFDIAEDKKGEPLNAARREARLTRKRLARRAKRLRNLLTTLKEAGLLVTDKIFVVSDKENLDPWTLRSQGLNRVLSAQEWIRVLYHLVKHRGFYVARKSEEQENNNSSDGELLKGLKRTKKLLSEKQYLSIGQMVANDSDFKEAKRNKNNSYKNTFLRSLLREELRILFEKQRDLGNPHAGKKLYEKVDDIFWKQNTALSGKQMLDMIGKCTFERTEYRAPRSSWTAERFIWLTCLNNLRVIQEGISRSLNDEERKKLIDFPYSHKGNITYSAVRKCLDLNKSVTFRDLDYQKHTTETKNNEGFTGIESKKLFFAKAFHDLRKLYFSNQLEQEWEVLCTDRLKMNSIALCLSIYKTDEELTNELQKINCNNKEIEALLNKSFSGFIKLSIKALEKIILHMEQGKRYNEACRDAGYCHSNQYTGDKRFLPKFSGDIKNPVVLRAFNQTRKVINAIIKRYGSPYAIHVELARDMSKSLMERRNIKNGQDEFARLKKDLEKEFGENFPNCEAKSKHLLKYRLYKEQDCICPYSNKTIDLKRLLEDGYVEVDHILPYSRSFDDSLNNKVLVFTSENRNKSDRTPYEYLGSNKEKWNRFELWVKSNKKFKQPKKDRLLRKELGQDFEKNDFARRNLNDTRYATKLIASYIKEHLRFADQNNKIPVLTPAGAFTSFLRSKWGLVKNREESDLHHAMDACIIATASHSLIRKVSEYSKSKKDYRIDMGTGEMVRNTKSYFPKPWLSFRDELLEKMSENSEHKIWVSRAPKRLKAGAVHKATINSAKYIDKGKSVERIALTEIPKYIYKKDGTLNEEVIVGLKDPRNEKFFQSLHDRLKKFPKSSLNENEFDAKKAFAEPFYKPLVDGSNGSIVRKIKIFRTQNSYVKVRNGIASREKMCRVDVFEKHGEFYLVPIYLDEICKKDASLPNKAASSGKDWLTIDETFNFRFSLHHNDCVNLKTKESEYFGYFAGLDVANAAINIRSHDNNMNVGNGTGVWRGLGLKRGIISFNKFHVDVLGNRYLVVSEKKRGLA